MTARHVVRRASDAQYAPPGDLAPDAVGLSRWRAVGYDDGASHTDFGISRLEAGGVVPTHVHSFEESFHVHRGRGGARHARSHRAPGRRRLRRDPDRRPRTRGTRATALRRGPTCSRRLRARSTAWTRTALPDVAPGTPTPVDPRDPRTRSFGNITADHMNPGRQSQELLAVSASMRTALLVYSGITLKMMVDSDLGAVLHTMFMVQYEPDGVAGPHDHPLEEAYLITDGEVDATFDGEEYRLQVGDIAWAGVGCVHSFRATGAPVRWVETQSPQMPPRHAYRFVRDWDYLETALSAQDHDGEEPTA